MDCEEKKEEVQEEKSDVQAEWNKIFERQEFKQLRESLPSLTSAIMEEFNKNRSVEIRSRLKACLKSLLSLASTDTEYSKDKISNSMAKKSTSSFRLGGEEEMDIG